MPPYSARYSPVLGTELHLLVSTGEDAVRAEQVQATVLDEIVRLENVLSTYRAQSPLSRWMRAEWDEGQAPLPPEVVAVLASAEQWFHDSAAALNPAVGGLIRLWRDAERCGQLPSREDCRRLAERHAELPYAVTTVGDRSRVLRLGDCSPLDLNAVAKGWIVDRAAEAGLAAGAEWLLVNIGGDLRLTGPGEVRIAVDDAPPLTVLTLRSGGFASSGSARRGFRIGDAWFGHVLDPRTGLPVDHTAGVSVLADDAATADALATVVGVLGLDDERTSSLLERHRAAAMVVTPEGDVRTTERWAETGGRIAPARG